MFFKIICRSSKKSTSSWPLGQFFHPLTLPGSPKAFSIDLQKRTAKSEFFRRWIIFFRNYCLNKYLSLEVSTVETNRDGDRDVSIYQDQLLKLVKIILTVKTRFFFSWSRFLKFRIFQLRLGHVEISVKIIETV
jgi:hypothetical protein